MNGGGIRETLVLHVPEGPMWIMATTVGAIVVAGFLIVLVAVVISIHVEDGRFTITGDAPGRATARTRRLLGLKVDHSICRKAKDPEHACPLCRNILQTIIKEDPAGE
ncbi:hypothetical protein ACSDR0_04120 [Streptosporangium sp. G11]|uniref:hypothetical protein n=1 Tax=Streptosporangium sp. G11 TaxID=3436926 RepID=UPI003EBF5623